jgi:predicted Zn-dependent protease with MMP-like domain
MSQNGSISVLALFIESEAGRGRTTMDRKKFEQLVERSLKRLPRKFLDALENISIEVESEPDEEILDDMGIEDGALYGLYQGTPLTEREWNYGNVLPDRIAIYQGPIERDARTDEEIEEIVLDTVVHEIGHYFGFDDETLYEIEDEKARRKGRS